MIKQVQLYLQYSTIGLNPNANLLQQICPSKVTHRANVLTKLGIEYYGYVREHNFGCKEVKNAILECPIHRYEK